MTKLFNCIYRSARCGLMNSQATTRFHSPPMAPRNSGAAPHRPRSVAALSGLEDHHRDSPIGALPVALPVGVMGDQQRPQPPPLLLARLPRVDLKSDGCRSAPRCPGGRGGCEARQGCGDGRPWRRRSPGLGRRACRRARKCGACRCAPRRGREGAARAARACGRRSAPSSPGRSPHERPSAARAAARSDRRGRGSRATALIVGLSRDRRRVGCLAGDDRGPDPDPPRRDARLPGDA